MKTREIGSTTIKGKLIHFGRSHKSIIDTLVTRARNGGTKKSLLEDKLRRNANTISRWEDDGISIQALKELLVIGLYGKEGYRIQGCENSGPNGEHVTWISDSRTAKIVKKIIVNIPIPNIEKPLFDEHIINMYFLEGVECIISFDIKNPKNCKTIAVRKTGDPKQFGIETIECEGPTPEWKESSARNSIKKRDAAWMEKRAQKEKETFKRNVQLSVIAALAGPSEPEENNPPPTQSKSSTESKLKKLKKLHEEGLIDDDDYDYAKKEALKILVNN